ncbi:MAG: hypothetical protein K2M64_01260, partial [Clostridia bacterium]|nr:hypothetical protein [Clostridia bacterium]
TYSDVTFQTESEQADTPATRRTMLLNLLSAGVLTDEQGKLSQSVKSKIMQQMGFANWNEQDLSQLHVNRAQKENLQIDKAEVLSVDDHGAHVEEHTRYIIANADKLQPQIKAKLLAHVEQHKQFIRKEQ